MNILRPQREPRTVTLIFILLALTNGIYHWGSIRFGEESLHGDATNVWKPLAQDVIEGVPLYIEPAVHNKPPLFSLLNILIEMTGYYTITFIIIISLTNAITAILIWRVCQLRELPQIGFVAGGLFLIALPLSNGYNVTVRSWALVGIMVALVRRNPATKAAALATGGLFSQYAIFAVPAIIYQHVQSVDRGMPDIGWMLRFVGTGLIIVASGYMLIGLIWGINSLIAGIKMSFLINDHVAGASAASPFADLRGWAKRLIYMSQQLAFILAPATITVGALITGNWEQSERSTVFLIASMCALMLFPLINRSFYTYWMYPLPFLSILAAFGYQKLL